MIRSRAPSPKRARVAGLPSIRPCSSHSTVSLTGSSRRRSHAADHLGLDLLADVAAKPRERGRLFLSDLADLVDTAGVIRVSCVCKQSAKTDRLGSSQRRGQAKAFRSTGIDAGAMVSAIDFQKNVKRVSMGPMKLFKRGNSGKAIEQKIEPVNPGGKR